MSHQQYPRELVENGYGNGNGAGTSMSASLSPNGGVQRGLSQQSHDMVRSFPYLYVFARGNTLTGADR